MGCLITQGNKPCFVTLAVFLFVWLLYLCLGYCTIEFFLPLLVVKGLLKCCNHNSHIQIHENSLKKKKRV